MISLKALLANHHLDSSVLEYSMLLHAPSKYRIQLHLYNNCVFCKFDSIKFIVGSILKQCGQPYQKFINNNLVTLSLLKIRYLDILWCSVTMSAKRKKTRKDFMVLKKRLFININLQCIQKPPSSLYLTFY